MSTGTCTTHSWNDEAEDDEGDPEMGLRVDQRLERREELYNAPRRTRNNGRPRSQDVAINVNADTEAEDW